MPSSVLVLLKVWWHQIIVCDKSLFTKHLYSILLKYFNSKQTLMRVFCFDPITKQNSLCTRNIIDSSFLITLLCIKWRIIWRTYVLNPGKVKLSFFAKHSKSWVSNALQPRIRFRLATSVIQASLMNIHVKTERMSSVPNHKPCNFDWDL